MYEIIRTFSPIFRGLNFENPRAAAIYYVGLIINFPTSLQGILNEAQAIYGNDINRQALHAARVELQKRGIIGRTYYNGSAEGHEYPDLQVGDEVNPRPVFMFS